MIQSKVTKKYHAVSVSIRRAASDSKKNGGGRYETVCFGSKNEYNLQKYSREMDSHRFALHGWLLSKLRTISHGFFFVPACFAPMGGTSMTTREGGAET